MAWSIQRKENYVFIQRDTDGYLHDYHAKDLTIRKKFVNVDEYTFYYNQEGKSILFLDKVPFADIIDGLTGLPFPSTLDFELWYTLNTGQFGGDGGGGPLPAEDLTKLYTTVMRFNKAQTVTTPYTAVSVIAYSDDVTINGTLLNQGTTWGISAGENEHFPPSFFNELYINGSDYLLTTIKRVY